MTELPMKGEPYLSRGKKGWRVYGPDGQYYVLTRDLGLGDHIRPGDFQPFNGAPNPVAGNPVVSWLAKAISPPFQRSRHNGER